MATSQTQANHDLDSDYGSGTPATIYAALATTVPSYTGDGSFTEPTTSDYGGYARVAVTNNVTNWPAAASGMKSNGTVITFPTSTGGVSAPCLPTYLVFVTTSSGAGQIIDALALPSGTTIALGAALTFPIAAIVISEA